MLATTTVSDPARSNSLTDLAYRIKTEHEAVAASVKESVRHAIAAGELLIEAKKQIGHGHWLPWLYDHCDVSERSAQVYMRLARNKSVIESNPQSTADLTVEGALKALAAPKAPLLDYKMTDYDRALILPNRGEISFGQLRLSEPIWCDCDDGRLDISAQELFLVMESECSPGCFWTSHYELYEGGSHGYMQQPLAGFAIKRKLINETRYRERFNDIEWRHVPAENFRWAFHDAEEYEARGAANSQAGAICSICSEPFADASILNTHNAWPVNDERCCGECNENVVLPARLVQIDIESVTAEAVPTARPLTHQQLSG